MFEDVMIYHVRRGENSLFFCAFLIFGKVSGKNSGVIKKAE